MKIFIAYLYACVAVVLSAPFNSTCSDKMPLIITECFGRTLFSPDDVTSNCRSLLSECDRANCLLKKYKYVTEDGKVDLNKLKAYYDEYAASNPEWKSVMDHLKAYCLREDLLPKGVYLNCTAYDLLYCTLDRFVKQTDPATRVSSPVCEAARRYAERCPFCPAVCLGRPSVGACHACRQP